MGTQGSGLVLARARAGLGLGFGPSRSTGPVGHSRVWPCPGPRARAALALVLALPDRPALLGTQGGLALSWPARGRPWPWFWPFQIDRPCWALKGVWPCPGPRAGGLGLGFGPSRSTGPVGHSRVWPCPGPHAGGLGLGFGPSRSTGPVGHSRGSGLVLASAQAALALVLALPDRPALLGTQAGLVLARARGRLGLGFGPSGSTGPVGHSRVWPCPGPRAGGLGLGFGPSRSTGPVGHSRGSGLVLARARAALALVLALPDRPALLGTQGSGLVLARARAALALVLALPDRPALLGTQGLALSWPARTRGPWLFQGFSRFFRVFQCFF